MMEIHAYNELYLSHAMQNLADMFDCGINLYCIPASQFFSRFVTSGVAGHFENGNPRYLVGYSGFELADMVIELSGGGRFKQKEKTCPLEKSKEYWAGWVLAYYQWKHNRSFSEMHKYGLSFETVVTLYHPLHEADPEKFCDIAEEIIKDNTKGYNPLKSAREQIGMTQKTLSEESGVSLRMIRAYEQKMQDMSRAEYGTVARLSKVLRIPAESLLCNSTKATW